jgi:two-component system chemotaxis response regulator CheB
MNETSTRIIVIGGSAGGFKAAATVISGIPPDLPVSIFVVLHVSKNSSPAIILQYFSKHTQYICSIPEDNQVIEPGHIYIAAPDLHLFVKKGIIRILNGAHENRWRPSIDVLFRSAAAAYDSNVIGIILSGMLDDGTSGMSAIKRSGGLCIVQEPVEAEFPDMPTNVLNNVDVDFRVPLADIGYILEDMLTKKINEHGSIPEDVKKEAEITERLGSSLEDMQSIGEHSNYTCPDCGGGLWKIKEETAPRYRCHTGHVYNEKVLLDKQSQMLEESVWVSIRMMEERVSLLKGIYKREHNGKTLQSAEPEYITSLKVHIERLKTLLHSLNKNGSGGESFL